MIQTQLIYCGDNLQKLRDLPDACVDLIYINPSRSRNQDYNVLFKERDGTRSAAPGDLGHLGELLEQHEGMNQQCW